jgi:uncharacterized protein YbjT (DUF2867 family)
METGMYLVIGAAGNVGREVTGQLLASGDKVRVLTRDEQKAAFPDGADVAEGDLTKPETLAAAMRDISKLYCLMRPGTADNLATAAKDAGVEHIVLLTSMSAAEPGNNPLGQAHRQAETAVAASGMAWTFLRPTSFASNSLAWAPAIRAGETVRAPFARLRSAIIDPRDIAAVAVSALRSSGHEGKTYPLTGPEPLSITDQVRIIGESLGREIGFAEQSEDEARASMLQRMPAQVVDALLASQRTAVDAEPPVLGTVAHVTGRPARSFRDWVTEHLPLFS